MALATLTEIRAKVRNLTHKPSATQLTDAQIDFYVNTFYLYDLPEELRLLNLKSTYTFNTERDVESYTFPATTVLSIQSPVFAGGYRVQLYQDRSDWFYYYPERANNVILTTGNGGVGPYTGTIQSVPVKVNRVFLSTIDGAGNSLTATDNGAGVFTGNVTGGTVNYDTGAIAALTWTAAVPLGNNIMAQSVQFTRGRPFSMLYYDNTFTVFPMPDQAYQVTMDAYIVPTALSGAASEPVMREWWQLLAYGAALKISIDDHDEASIQHIVPWLEDQKMKIGRKKLMQIKQNKVKTIYDDDNYTWRYPYRSNF